MLKCLFFIAISTIAFLADAQDSQPLGQPYKSFHLYTDSTNNLFVIDTIANTQTALNSIGLSSSELANAIRDSEKLDAMDRELIYRILLAEQTNAPQNDSKNEITVDYRNLIHCAKTFPSITEIILEEYERRMPRE